jgi:hypothetical protein
VAAASSVGGVVGRGDFCDGDNISSTVGLGMGGSAATLSLWSSSSLGAAAARRAEE